MSEGQLPPSTSPRALSTSPRARKRSGELEPTSTATRISSVTAGKGFHHYPLVFNKNTYGYDARVTDEGGASVVLVPKETYVALFKRVMYAPRQLISPLLLLSFSSPTTFSRRLLPPLVHPMWLQTTNQITLMA